jgi:hypothetical protein
MGAVSHVSPMLEHARLFYDVERIVKSELVSTRIISKNGFKNVFSSS